MPGYKSQPGPGRSEHRKTCPIITTGQAKRLNQRITVRLP
ncbi:hypothetical protein BACCOPRO_01495 [Phocaeicola coprophilus DSM 18228 = JCM 13818]|uniref:Uncharacterized protein n=1 Tax=Phocaeicola coprophilus DSM 18228 = JCM 13818 TaxID=547042 RepID=S0FC33_9BACT|nr:hypothetical protein BACCOPRO_01495 [Phocaeicola coprophilus DSM 18228 = JCM 13818]